MKNFWIFPVVVKHSGSIARVVKKKQKNKDKPAKKISTFFHPCGCFKKLQKLTM
jgi:hypothetical protein